MKKLAAGKIRNVIVISDTHCGCQVGLCPPDGAALDGGGVYMPSKIQLMVWSMWREFWDKWVPRVTHGEPFAVVHNGDAIDGIHHGSTTQISHNIEDQVSLAYKVLAPVVKACGGRYYHIRGTEAHVGKSAEYEENLAKRLGAIPGDGVYARWEMWMRIGKGLAHFSHHIGTTGSTHGEATAVNAELATAFNEAGRWGLEPPQIVVRSHRHRNIEVRVPTANGYGMSIVTAGWQMKTPFTFRIPGGRQSQPQIGGTILRLGDEELHARHQVWSLARAAEVAP